MAPRSLRSLVQALVGRRAGGRPGSTNGASSFHLWWELSRSARLVEVSAVLEVVVPPAVDSLYFWALQVDFVDGPAHRGGAHTGLQWYGRFPGSTAVNWGGYASEAAGGGVLAGSASTLPGFADEPNTRSYPWQPGRPYRFRVYRSPEQQGAWRSEVTDVLSGRTIVIRDLYAGGRHLAAPLVWSEVFADCDAPSVTVRWSELRAVDEAGVVLAPRAVLVNYQSPADGGCSNTTVALDGDGVLQITNAERTVPQGSSLELRMPRYPHEVEAAGRVAVSGISSAGGVRAVLFDFDGTLTAPGAIDFAAIREAVGCPPDQLILEYIDALKDPAEKRRCLDLLEDFEIAAATASRPNAGAEEVVQSLCARGLGLGIVSRNGRASIDRAFRNFTEIDQTWFQAIISRDSAVPPKPAPDGVLMAAQTMHVDPARMLMVGDYVLDVQAGHAAGAITVFLEDHWRLEEFGVTADFVIRDLREIEAIIGP